MTVPRRILVVDDEPMVAKLAGMVLEQEGYEVSVAAGAAEALALVASGLRVDLVLSDFLMPSMNGQELIRRVQECSPSTVAVLMTGYMADALPKIPVVHKPFSVAALLAVVTRALEGSAIGGQGPGDRAGSQATLAPSPQAFDSRARNCEPPIPNSQ